MPEVLLHQVSDVQRGGFQDQLAFLGMDLDPVDLLILRLEYQGVDVELVLVQPPVDVLDAGAEVLKFLHAGFGHVAQSVPDGFQQPEHGIKGFGGILPGELDIIPVGLGAGGRYDADAAGNRHRCRGLHAGFRGICPER